MKLIFHEIAVISWILCFIIPHRHCARILAIYPAEARSHYQFHETLMKILLNAGHHVTLITPFESQDAHENLTQIFIKETKERDNDPFKVLASPEIPWFIHCVTHVFNLANDYCRWIMLMEEIKTIESIDVVFVELAPFWQCYLPLAEKHGAPVIGTIPFHLIYSADPAVGNPRFTSVSPSESRFIDPKMNFYARLQNFFYAIENQVILYFMKQRERKINEELFYSPNGEIHVSLMFANTHASVLPRALVPNAIGIGGIQVKLAKLNPLPKNFQTFLDEAPQGVILFALGTITTEAALNHNLRTALIRIFKKIPQRIIWKFDGQIDGLSSNVLLTKWLPQKEILAHENTVAFISHCGINGLYEAIYFGKPLVLMPIFGDQYSNAALLSSLGVGVFLNIQEVTEEKLSAALNEIINSTKFRQQMEELSKKFRDDPVPPADLFLYWTEHVIRHKGAPHMRFSGADLPAYEYFSIDVVIFTAITLVSILLAAKFFVRLSFIKLRMIPFFKNLVSLKK